MSTALRTVAQNRRIHGLVGQLKQALEAEDAQGLLRQLCRQASGQEHSSRLTVGQAVTVIQGLESQVAALPSPAPDAAPVARKPWGPRGEGPRDQARISPTQQQTLAALFLQAGLDTPSRRQAFARRQCGQPWPQTKRDCDAIFEALSAMILRDVKVEDVLARARVLAELPATRRHAFFCVFIPDLIRQIEGSSEKALTTHKLRKLVEAETQFLERP